MAIVYQHRRKDDNSIFYIGIGKTYNRAYSKSGRNKYWHHIANKIGYVVEILYPDCDENFAKKIERELIESIGRVCKKTGGLVNITEGGDNSDTNKNRICINKDNKERFIYEDEYINYEKNGWSKGRCNKTKENIGRSNAISQLGKNHSFETIQKMKGKRSPYKISEELKNHIIDLYKIKTIEEISDIVKISFPSIIKILKDNNVYSTKRKNKTCPYCNVTGAGSNMSRYHFNNCKQKIN